jgi:hypothetical protein
MHCTHSRLRAGLNAVRVRLGAFRGIHDDHRPGTATEVAARDERNPHVWAIARNVHPLFETCDNDKPYEPTAMRRHALGSTPLWSALLAEGVLRNDRVGFSDRVHAPVEGTPLPRRDTTPRRVEVP